ncbi:hypothetical protein B0H16DRAFT_1454179 [Mycena metata]|uniref:Uncharacterized protein n=1 Tax=Mycena metata TaxID=1033252 RepID=A0AAD7NKH7_9AGAR|nr:hypothetical protein B0H16DRAFT_1454179 [Mycena metata]
MSFSSDYAAGVKIAKQNYVAVVPLLESSPPIPGRWSSSHVGPAPPRPQCIRVAVAVYTAAISRRERTDTDTAKVHLHMDTREEIQSRRDRPYGSSWAVVPLLNLHPPVETAPPTMHPRRGHGVHSCACNPPSTMVVCADKIFLGRSTTPIPSRWSPQTQTDTAKPTCICACHCCQPTDVGANGDLQTTSTYSTYAAANVDQPSTERTPPLRIQFALRHSIYSDSVDVDVRRVALAELTLGQGHMGGGPGRRGARAVKAVKAATNAFRSGCAHWERLGGRSTGRAKRVKDDESTSRLGEYSMSSKVVGKGKEGVARERRSRICRTKEEGGKEEVEKEVETETDASDRGWVWCVWESKQDMPFPYLRPPALVREYGEPQEYGERGRPTAWMRLRRYRAWNGVGAIGTALPTKASLGGEGARTRDGAGEGAHESAVRVARVERGALGRGVPAEKDGARRRPVRAAPSAAGAGAGAGEGTVLASGVSGRPREGGGGVEAAWGLGGGSEAQTGFLRPEVRLRVASHGDGGALGRRSGQRQIEVEPGGELCVPGRGGGAQGGLLVLGLLVVGVGEGRSPRGGDAGRGHRIDK